jgi:hypothetical protein
LALAKHDGVSREKHDALNRAEFRAQRDYRSNPIAIGFPGKMKGRFARHGDLEPSRAANLKFLPQENTIQIAGL